MTEAEPVGDQHANLLERLLEDHQMMYAHHADLCHLCKDTKAAIEGWHAAEHPCTHPEGCTHCVTEANSEASELPKLPDDPAGVCDVITSKIVGPNGVTGDVIECTDGYSADQMHAYGQLCRDTASSVTSAPQKLCAECSTDLNRGAHWPGCSKRETSGSIGDDAEFQILLQAIVNRVALGDDSKEARVALITFLDARQPVAAPSDEFAGIRLRAVAKLVGLHDGVVPEGDKAADDCRFTILGWIAKELRKSAAPVAQGEALTDVIAELARIKRVAACGTVDSFLALPDQDKRYWFAQCIEESERCKLAESRLHFLHSTNTDAEGWEYGVARVRWNDGEIEFLWSLSDHSDIDAAILAKRAGSGA